MDLSGFAKNMKDRLNKKNLLYYLYEPSTKIAGWHTEF